MYEWERTKMRMNRHQMLEHVDRVAFLAAIPKS